MTRHPTLGLIAVAVLAASTSAQFSGAYDVANWTFENTLSNTDGTIDVGGAPGAIVMTGGDNGSGSDGYTRFTIPCVGNGLFTFDWSVEHPDPGFDVVGFVIGDEEYDLTVGSGDGSETVLICPGETLGFFIYTPDNDLGAPTLTVSGFSAPVTDPWTNLGGGIPGSFGQPVLKFTGSLQPGPVRLEVTHGTPFGSTFWVASSVLLAAPFKGGVLVPDPASEIIISLPLDGDGQISIQGPWPAGLPSGISFYNQCWALDPGAVEGLAASDGIQGTTP